MAEPRPADRRFLSDGAVLPVAPSSGEVLPVLVAADEVDRAIALLAEFPAEPAADTPGDGVDTLLDRERVRRARARAGREGGDAGTTVLFVSDTHLGYENRVETGSGKTVPWVGEVSSCDAFSRVVRVAVAREVDAVVHTGDVLDHEVAPETLAYADACLETLSNHGIPFYCILGSHDHDAADPKYAASVDGVAWLDEQVEKGHLRELSTGRTAVAGGSLDAYGVSAGNVGLDGVGEYRSLEWGPSDVAFAASTSGPNVLCLHDGVTPYRSGDAADVDVDWLLSQSRVSFDCVLVGDEHRPKNDEFETGYTFEASDGTPVLYTGPAIRVSHAYRDRDAFVTELTITADRVTGRRHAL